MEKSNEEYIEDTLLKIIKENLKVCEENKTVPSSGILDTINTLVNFKNCY